jgi:hypothetical protein
VVSVVDDMPTREFRSVPIAASKNGIVGQPQKPDGDCISPEMVFSENVGHQDAYIGLW